MNLLDPPAKSHKNGYGEYNLDHIERIKFIKKLKSFGFSLKEIKEAIDLEIRGDLSDKLRVDTLENKLMEVDLKLEELASYRLSLIEAIGYIKDRMDEEL